MKTSLRSIALAIAATIGLAAMAQQPYAVTINGFVSGCNANSYVNIASLPTTFPAIDIDVPVLPPSCSFSITLAMASQGGGFTISIPCLGAIQSQVVQYQVPPALDSTAVSVSFNCGNSPMDCLGVPGGTALPGTACVTFLNQPGTWSANCLCVANALSCQACFSVTSSAPWSADFSDCSTGTPPLSYQWWLPNGSASSQASESWVFTMEGVYGVCLTIADGSGCTSTLCDSIYVDANGGINTGPIVFDCLQVPNGPDMPGTPCTTPNGAAGIWSANCACVANALVDCEGVAGGPAVPGTACVVMGGGVVLTGTWTSDCVCDTSGTGATDCLGILNGPNVPGAPCSNPLGGTGIWSANCVCESNSNPDCQAGFWVFQAYTIDSLNPNGGAIPIPNELWIWNLSSGGTGNYQFLWSFGDGTSSTDPFPTHFYANGGPYDLCLTIWDDAGCTDTYCDSVAIDDDGFYTGMVLEESYARSGFTINVLNQLPTGIGERPTFEDALLWPNPVSDALYLAFTTSVRGNVPVTVFDLNGRTVVETRIAISSGTNRLELSTEGLKPGMYLLRIGNGADAVPFRFVKN
ncbi:MAG: T9SS type A sorting domain-containing protein [Flavobacteriales bacterium]|nr:T9SS type A sorting domain-containing protein [Flavobacteriales bacterium]